MTRKVSLLILMVALCFSLGCISVGTREIIMPDQEVLGNQGYMEGSSSSAYKERGVKTKKIYDIEIEVPDLFQKEANSSYDQTIWGNQGYLQKGSTDMPYIYVAPRKKVLPAIESEEVYKSEDSVKSMEPSSLSLEPASATKAKYMEYVVGEGDSLWIISKRVYGDASKWNLIAENNQDVLKGCKYLKPGMILKLPVLSESRSKYIK